jgi:hypothetical protein
MNKFEIHDNIPYYCVLLTAEQTKLVRNRQMEIYALDGQTFFPIKDKDGKLTGEYVFYVMFK